ncbi:DUF982 domain-containing protein [Rhizobium sp. CSW-27]|uniref:DUF982 domain-containing protein n=1 Tax=Rhizobium sp. CSW-27 TaxID=2839985 RepID=UPI001C02BBFB|nr:DUF982 domain-containing protein [Rhizobium sp. CSW-27]MBT9370936.1 DUF982 domain-containing protein [Rhizobium sp. CSW-27]
MERTPWNPPVRIGRDSVGDALEALAYMERRWPRIKGMCFAEAHLACLAALDGRQAAADARTRFMAAVEEARLH